VKIAYARCKMCLDYSKNLHAYEKHMHPNRVRMRVTDMPSVVDPVRVTKGHAGKMCMEFSKNLHAYEAYASEPGSNEDHRHGKRG